MKLTPKQRRGIEERFAVLQEHIKFSLRLDDNPDLLAWWTRVGKDIETCRDEVLTLVERIEPESVREGEDK